MAKRATARKPAPKAKPKAASGIKRSAPAKKFAARKVTRKPAAAAASFAPFRSKRDWTSFLFWLNDISRAGGVAVPEQFRPALAMSDGGGGGSEGGGDGGGGGSGGEGGGDGGGGGGEGGGDGGGGP